MRNRSNLPPLGKDFFEPVRVNPYIFIQARTGSSVYRNHREFIPFQEMSGYVHFRQPLSYQINYLLTFIPKNKLALSIQDYSFFGSPYIGKTNFDCA